MGMFRHDAGGRLPMNAGRMVFNASLLLMLARPAAAAGQLAKEYYFAIEMNGTICGYSKFTASPLARHGQNVILLKHEMLLRIAALGSKVESRLNLTYHIDPATGRFTYHDSTIEQGEMKLSSSIRIAGGQAFVSGSGVSQEQAVALPPDVVLANTLYHPHLVADFAGGKLTSKSYPIFDGRDSQVQETVYRKVGTETVRRAGREYPTIVLDVLNKWNGMKSRLWLDLATGIAVQTQHPNRFSYLADASVVASLQTANLDSNFLVKTNVSIPNSKAISYLKVRATIEPMGLWVSPEALSLEGQRFAGTVKDNLVEGVFEVEHRRYDGSQAPPFPPDFSPNAALKEYLEASELIQSDDPVLADKAREITKGSHDSWEAARRLSRWVSENIQGAIPGGGTARGVYDSRSGECGGHSFLMAAFCRAVGIPARVVWGCLHLPERGGIFGQHGWNEIFMGEAGWIPLDTTAGEIDYVDSGHIRIGIHQSTATALNARKMEILDYRLGSSNPSEPKPAVSAKYDRYLGEYTHSSRGNVHVVIKEGSLVLDIPGKISLALKEPNEKGIWQSILSDRIYVTFGVADSGAITEASIHEILPLRRTGPLDAPPPNLPAELRGYPGKYLLMQAQAEFLVQYGDGALLLNNLAGKRITRLKPPGADGRWQDESGNLSIRFALDAKGEVESLVMESITRFRRQDETLLQSIERDPD
jgi:transglutaminase-like putative cysteine protease